MYVYILITRTPTFVGKVIRRVLDNKYNHMSISLDKDLTEVYSFGRKSVKNFMDGGPTKESYHTLSVGTGETVDLCVFKIPVTKMQYERLKTFIDNVFEDADGYIYNFADALGRVFRRKIRVNKCYTCIEFCSEALEYAKIEIGKKLYNVSNLDEVRKILKRYIAYEGRYRAYPDVFLEVTENDIDFLKKNGFYKEFKHTAKSFKKFAGRMYKTKFPKNK